MTAPRGKSEPKGLARIIEEVSKSSVAQRKKELTGEKDSEPEDLNKLPMPEDQVIVEGKHIEWIWETPKRTFSVTAILYLSNASKEETSLGDKPVKKGEYEIFLTKRSDRIFLSSDEAKEIGKALISASHYINIWRENAGYFLERNLGLLDEKSSDA